MNDNKQQDEHLSFDVERPSGETLKPTKTSSDGKKIKKIVRKKRKTKANKKKVDGKSVKKDEGDGSEAREAGEESKKSVKPVHQETQKLSPIFEDDLKQRVMYLRKRLFFCKDEDKRKSYENHLEKLFKRPLICFSS